MEPRIKFVGMAVVAWDRRMIRVKPGDFGKLFREAMSYCDGDLCSCRAHRPRGHVSGPEPLERRG